MIIDETLCDYILDFIQPRPTIPKDVEEKIVQKHIMQYKTQLIGKEINPNIIEKFKVNLKAAYFSTLMQPGETVGIICGQCIGEKTTQSSLNNFHSAGLDTGSYNQIDNLQSIINASKIKKSESKKFFKVKLYMNNRNLSLNELRQLTRQYIDEVKFEDIIIDIKKKVFIQNDCHYDIFLSKLVSSDSDSMIAFKLNLEKLFNYRISTEFLIQTLAEKNNNCWFFIVPYSLLSSNSTYITLYCKTTQNVFEFVRKIKDTKLSGIQGVKSHIYSQTEENEWYIECLAHNFSIFFSYPKIFDLKRISCDSIHEMYSTFGVLAAKELIVKKCKSIIPGIDDAYFKLLAMRMTKSGHIEPLTRYTMRNNNSPLAKASFEESFETFIKAAKYLEHEKFNSISSAIICGKKPRIGTYHCDILIDKSFYELH